MNLFKYHTEPEQLVGYADRMQLVPELALEAAKKGDRSPEVLAAISISPRASFHYAMDVINGPWPPGETAIAQSSKYSYWYARNVIKKPWPPGETAIAQDSLYSYLYARNVIKKPWSPGETAIAQDSEDRKDYNQFLKDNGAGYQI